MTRRGYVCDATYRIAVWSTPDNPRLLQEIADSLLSPVFFLYAGRLSCPLTAPLDPQIISGGSVLEAFRAYAEYVGYTDELVQSMLHWEDPPEHIEVGVECEQSASVRDSPMIFHTRAFGLRTAYSGRARCT